MDTNPTGYTENYIKAYDHAAELLIRSVVDRGTADVILLDNLCELLNANTRAKRISVLWAVRRCKDNGLLAKTKIKKVYAVIK